MSRFIHPYSLELTLWPKDIRPQYRDYLQAKSHVEDVSYAISQSSREMIGTVTELHERGYESVELAVSELGDRLIDGFESVTWKLEDISQGVDALNAKFDWGFSQMIAGIGRVNDSLKQLIAIAKTPSETWAYEQHEIARDAIRRELYPEAVDALSKAINGHGDHVGYKLEYRFHYMLGVLHLGDANNTDPEVLNLAKAETSFLTAARYAKSDYPKEAGVALTAAGWAAYCQEKLAEAESHTRQATAIHPSHGEAFYQLAKIQMHLDRPHEAIPNLRRAVELDANYTIKAATDPDVLKHRTAFHDLIDSLRQEAQRLASLALDRAKVEMGALREWKAETNFGADMKLLGHRLTKVGRSYSANTFLGYLAAKLTADELTGKAKRLLETHRQEMWNTYSEGRNGLIRFKSSIQSRAVECSPYFSFGNVEEILSSIQGGVESHSDYVSKMDALAIAHEQLRLACEACRTGVVRRKFFTLVGGTMLGAVVGALVGIIPIVLVGLIVTFVLFIGKPASEANPFFEMFMGICLIVVASIGARVYWGKTLAAHLAFVARLGPEPQLPSIDWKGARPGDASRLH